MIVDISIGSRDVRYRSRAVQQVGSKSKRGAWAYIRSACATDADEDGW